MSTRKRKRHDAPTGRGITYTNDDYRVPTKAPAKSKIWATPSDPGRGMKVLRGYLPRHPREVQA